MKCKVIHAESTQALERMINEIIIDKKDISISYACYIDNSDYSRLHHNAVILYNEA